MSRVTENARLVCSSDQTARQPVSSKNYYNSEMDDSSCGLEDRPNGSIRLRKMCRTFYMAQLLLFSLPIILQATSTVAFTVSANVNFNRPSSTKLFDNPTPQQQHKVPPYPALEEEYVLTEGVYTSSNGSNNTSSSRATTANGSKNGVYKSPLFQKVSNGKEQINGYSNGKTTTNGYLQSPSDVPASLSSGTASSSDSDSSAICNGVTNHNGSKESSHVDCLTHTPPEVNHWTEIMTRGFLDSTNGGNDTSWDAVLSDLDLQEIEKYWDSIMPTVSYLGTERVAKVYQALCVAYRAHRGQKRKSGEPFIIHPVEVSLLLSGLKMDAETVMAGLLHDTVEDTDLTFAQVETLFGPTVRGIVEGETKVSKLPKLAFTDYADEQAENLRQMFVAMTDDYRIIIVKLADRLHNMRTLKFMKPEKQIKISRETLDIFAPLAHRMGIWQFKSELEDTAFMYLYPQEYKRLNRRLRQHQTKYRETLENAKAILEKQINIDSTLQQQAAKVEVFGRTKEIYSLWHKMETKQEYNLDHIVDVVALRVVITPRHVKVISSEEASSSADRGIWLCYHVLGLVQHLPGFLPMPTRVKDYISFPKPNGYQSLHTALILNGQTIEVQIRTSMMHQVAEFGMASHWAYTDDKRRGSAEALFNTPWLASIKEWQNDKISSRDFVDSVRRELLGKRVFVFLRNGKILNLARGATAIDAAFQIHTEVGLKMHGVEINGKPVPLSYELKNGDVVSILTGKGKPATDWMRYAKSRSTRSKLRAYFRSKQKESLREAGKILLMDYLWTHAPLIEKESYLDEKFNVPLSTEDLDDFLPGKTRFLDVEDLLVSIGRSHDRHLLHSTVATMFEVPKKMLVEAEINRRSLLPHSVVAAISRRKKQGEVNATIDTEFEKSGSIMLPPAPYSVERLLTGIDVGFEYADIEYLCEDCLPIRGDDIVGTRPSDKEAVTTVHRIGCPHAQRAVNHALSLQKDRKKDWMSIKNTTLLNVPGTSIPGMDARVDSVSLRQRKSYVWQRAAKNSAHQNDVPVRLHWSDTDEEGDFLAEVVVHCQDRKLLLADCSEVVSETVEIMRTGSSSTDEHATLLFLVRVASIQHLQNLMNRLVTVRSVLSVERRFGSALL